MIDGNCPILRETIVRHFGREFYACLRSVLEYESRIFRGAVKLENRRGHHVARRSHVSAPAQQPLLVHRYRTQSLPTISPPPPSNLRQACHQKRRSIDARWPAEQWQNSSVRVRDRAHRPDWPSGTAVPLAEKLAPPVHVGWAPPTNSKKMGAAHQQKRWAVPTLRTVRDFFADFLRAVSRIIPVLLTRQ